MNSTFFCRPKSSKSSNGTFPAVVSPRRPESMAATKTHLGILVLVLLFLFVHTSASNLDAADQEAFRQLAQSLGLPGQRRPCDSVTVFCSSGRITRIVLRSQRLSGSLSPAIGKLSELVELSLPGNEITGKIPPQIAQCKKLQVLDVSNNQFSGHAPEKLSLMVGLRSLDLSSNMFSGELSFLRHLRGLESISVADNLFTGKLPDELLSFRHLRYLNFTGNILQARSTGHRVTYRDFVPRRARLAEISTSPHALAPAPGPAAGSHRSRNTSSSGATAKAPAPSPPHHKKRKEKKKLLSWVVGFFIGAMAGITSGVFCSLIFRIMLNCLRRRHKTSTIEIFSPKIIKNPKDLEFLEKPDGLALLESIGRGACGEVYRAVLQDGSGRLIAIKKISNPANYDASAAAADINEEDSKLIHRRLKQIRSEIQTVGHIRHRNLLPLLAHVRGPDCHYLIYEFIKNGSLHDVMAQVNEGRRELVWPARLRIVEGIAEGLEYLHHNQSQCIIHRDLKPANVLIDDDMEARITDFGLAKALPEYHTHVTSSNVVGTLGYIAPEYHQTLKFTDKCDIYSFGVLLAAVVIGRLPSDEFFQSTEEMSLVKWLRNVVTSGEPQRAIDPRLRGDEEEEEQMLLVLKIACFCTVDDPKERPNSKDVVRMLRQVQQSKRVSTD